MSEPPQAKPEGVDSHSPPGANINQQFDLRKYRWDVDGDEPWPTGLCNIKQPNCLDMYNFGHDGDELASHSGTGTVEMLEVVRLLKDAGISSCVVGVHPLGYYGAGRVPIVWELCVPEDKLDDAAGLFKSEPLSQSYEPWPVNEPISKDLLHIFPRFHLKGVHFVFSLVSDRDWLVDCDETKCEKSFMGLPYPKLEYWAQSLLDTQRFGDLEDLIDGMNLSEEWGEEHLDLDRTANVDYAKWKNEQIRASIPETPYSVLKEMSEYARPLRPVWQKAVRGKKSRIGPELPEGHYHTRFYPISQGDPRLEERVMF
ncbi:hypothetical protein PG996_015441 [Apiospora saccharicola]|uniref:Uncharacterized protein n=1 Tax=Apiospora saccharicola TaxID=335842 RepID=A0ABR1TLV4_9PEZI